MFIRYVLNGEKLECKTFQDIINLENYNDIIELYCYSNQLTSLPTLPKTLTHLSCSGNQLTFLPVLPKSLIHFQYYNNPIYDLIKDYFKGDRKLYNNHNKKILTLFSNKIKWWFLNCRENPEFKYCRDRLNLQYDELFL